MKFELTDLTKADLINLLEKDTKRSFQSKTDAKLAHEAYEALIPSNPTYPRVYLFTELGRDHDYADFNNYVLVDDEDTGAQIYKAITSTTKDVYWGANHVLEEIAESWQGDILSILVEVYGVKHTSTPVGADDRGFSVWVDYHSAQKSHYISNTKDEPINFGNKEAAQEFIDSRPDVESYKFAKDEDCLPDYQIVAAPTAEILIPETKTLK